MKTHAEAVRYAANGWPVAPLAVPHRAGCPCGKACVDPHLVGEVVHDGFRAAEVWPEPPRTRGGLKSVGRWKRSGAASGGVAGWDGSLPEWRGGIGAEQPKPAGGRGVGLQCRTGGGLGIALVTEEYDVMQLPARFGAPLNHLLKAGVPTAMAPATRTWWFFVVQGSVPRELVVQAGGVLRSGGGDWVPAPGTWTEDTGRIRWLVHPYLTEWRPYQRKDPIDQVLGCL